MVLICSHECGTRIRDANLKKKHDAFANLFVYEKKFMANESWLFYNFPTLLWICLKKKKIQSSRFHTHSGNFQFFQFPIPPKPPLPSSPLQDEP